MALSVEILFTRVMQIDERTGTHSQKPRIKLFSCPRAHHLNKLLHKEVGLINLWIKLSQLAHRLLLFYSQVLRAAQKQKGGKTFSRKDPCVWRWGSLLAPMSRRSVDELRPHI